MKTLVEIMQDLPTDKVTNGLAQRYDPLFAPIREKVTRLLEIGIDKGGSLAGWHDYFPNADIWGLDIHQSERMMDLSSRRGRITLLFGNAAVRDEGRFFRQRFFEESFDIIIDDGSHYNTDVFAAFESLWPFVKKGGYYIVEDIQVPYYNPEHLRIKDYFLKFKTYAADECFYDDMLWIRKPGREHVLEPN